LILLTIAMVHVERPATVAVNLFILSTAVAACLVLLMVNDRPFGTGGITVQPEALRELGSDWPHDSSCLGRSAAMSACGNYGSCRVAEAIIGGADLTIGARVRDVLEAEQHSATWCSIRLVAMFGPVQMRY
jgi:hypothetical protein